MPSPKKPLSELTEKELLEIQTKQLIEIRSSVDTVKTILIIGVIISVIGVIAAFV